MQYSKQHGSHLVSVLFAVVVVGVIGVAGVKVWQMQKPGTESSVAPVASSKAVPATIANTASLKQASNALDASSADINNSLDDTALNADLSSTL